MTQELMYDIAFLHTGEAHIATFQKLIDELAPELKVSHTVNESLLLHAQEFGEDEFLLEKVKHELLQLSEISELTVCTCSSIEGVLMGERGWQLETGGFPRGIAQIGDGWVVGISELKERRERDFTDARLQFYNANWEKTGALCIPKVGMVLDLMTVSPDLLPASVGTLPVVAD